MVASWTRSPRKFCVRRISAAPGRKRQHRAGIGPQRRRDRIRHLPLQRRIGPSARDNVSRPGRRGLRWRQTGASPSSLATRAPSSVADITRMRRSSRKPSAASRASARPRSASSERSWNSSNRTAAMPFSSGSSRICREKIPSVTTSIRVARDTFEPNRTR